MRPLLLGLLAAAAAPPATAAPVPKNAPKTNAAKIVGTWKMVKSTNGLEKQAAITVELTAGGAITLRTTPLDDPDGETLTEVGTYKVDGDKVSYTFKSGGRERAATDAIKKLTDDEQVLVDPNGVEEEYVRVRK